MRPQRIELGVCSINSSRKNQSEVSRQRAIPPEADSTDSRAGHGRRLDL